MDRCRLQGATGDALHAPSCALGYNIRRLMRSLLAKARRALLRLDQMAAVAAAKWTSSAADAKAALAHKPAHRSCAWRAGYAKRYWFAHRSR